MPSDDWLFTTVRLSVAPPPKRRPTKRNKGFLKSLAFGRFENRVLEPLRAPRQGLRIPPSDPGRRRRENLRRRSQRAIQGDGGEVTRTGFPPRRAIHFPARRVSHSPLAGDPFSRPSAKSDCKISFTFAFASIEKLGKAGETVKVAPGYFRNHLMPKLLAVPNIDKFAYLIKEQRKIYQPKEEEVQVVTKNVEDKSKVYEKAAYRLLNGRLVGRQLCVQIDPENLHLPTPLETFGLFDVQLRMPKSIPLPEGRYNWTLKVKIQGK
ncbi:hypothetical protein ES288_D02G033300v1 [Gossypium darwinii]|uniref:Large ribosomal subunit protein bL9c n=1 Tax=Gossypium darwinii TaxID=34276 RepID=A0A5D2DBU2_GOSDA|nr:hypothetical protein ES288_D02G033300v1 [Gossypium darwinii]